jgi:hypothetical protein
MRQYVLFKGRHSLISAWKGNPTIIVSTVWNCCEGKSEYVSNLEVYVGTVTLTTDHRTAFSGVGRLCQKVKKIIIIYMDRGTSRPTSSNFKHL